jgi:competence protein CoiA
VILKKGTRRVHHFAHQPSSTCALGAGETAEHHRAKLAIYDSLRGASNVIECEVEKPLHVSIADVYARISGIQVAIEIQRSNLSEAEIRRRTLTYHSQGIAVVWVALARSQSAPDRYSPRPWELWWHAAAFGRVYIWHSGDVLQPVHFEKYVLDVPYSEWREDGEDRSAGGYDKVSRRWRKPIYGPPAALSRDFKVSCRRASSMGRFDFPECTLFLDRHPAWWKKGSTSC